MVCCLARPVDERVMAYVILQSGSDMAAALARPRASARAARDVHSALVRYGARVLPPPSPAPRSAGDPVYTTIEVPRMDDAAKLARELRGIAGVEAAYVKPAEELP